MGSRRSESNVLGTKSEPLDGYILNHKQHVYSVQCGDQHIMIPRELCNYKMEAPCPCHENCAKWLRCRDGPTASATTLVLSQALASAPPSTNSLWRSFSRVFFFGENVFYFIPKGFLQALVPAFIPFEFRINQMSQMKHRRLPRLEPCAS